MSQGFIAGGTSYENQSLSDIIHDIHYWIKYSKEIITFFEKQIEEINQTDFINKIPFDYLLFIQQIPKICRTNIDDFNRVLNAIETHTLTRKKIEMFCKIGKRAHTNSDNNRYLFKCSNDGNWHDYSNNDFYKVEDLYAKFEDYCATLWDVTNAAHRLQDYIDTHKEITTMKYEDKSIHIGDGNKIENTNFNSEVNNSSSPENIFFKNLFWKLIVPILVGVIVAVICFYLKINN